MKSARKTRSGFPGGNPILMWAGEDFSDRKEGKNMKCWMKRLSAAALGVLMLAQTGVRAEAPRSEGGKAAPYTMRLDALTPIFEGPDYDFSYARMVGEDGVYTIVEEASDARQNVWGRLKSGVGWVCLTQVRSQQDAPLRAGFAETVELDETAHYFAAEESEYREDIVFEAARPLRDVRLCALEIDGETYREQRTLFSLEELTEAQPLVAGVVFYGDLTAYGLSFWDGETETRRYFAVGISGRNGALVLSEYHPAQSSNE